MENDKDDQKPMFLRGAELLAEIRGISVKEFLADYARSLRTATYPGPDCLLPEECAAVACGETLPSDRQEHLSQCDACAGCVDAIKENP